MISAIQRPIDNSYIACGLAFVGLRHISNIAISLSNAQCSTVMRYLLLGWKCKAVATECGISSRSIHRIQENLMRYGSVRKPPWDVQRSCLKQMRRRSSNIFFMKGGDNRMDEIKYWLWHEREVDIHQSTISK